MFFLRNRRWGSMGQQCRALTHDASSAALLRHEMASVHGQMHLLLLKQMIIMLLHLIDVASVSRNCCLCNCCLYVVLQMLLLLLQL